MTLAQSTSLAQVTYHFDRTAYLALLATCANRYTDAETLLAHQATYMSPSEPRAASQSKDKDDHEHEHEHDVLTLQDLSSLMAYKLCRGKWRPRLQQMIDGNDANLVKQVTRVAAAPCPDASSTWGDAEVEQRIKALVQLKGVGPATASLILTVCHASLPFFSDDLAAFHMESTAKLKYTVKEYLELIHLHRAWLTAESSALSEDAPTARHAEEMIWYWMRTRPDEVPGKTGKRKTDSDSDSRVSAKSRRKEG